MDKRNMRDDSILYTGTTSASFATQKTNPVIEEKKKEKSENKTKLGKAGEVVVKFFDDEIEKLHNIDYLNIEEMLTDEHFKAELMARKKTVEKLRDIKSKIVRILESK